MWDQLWLGATLVTCKAGEEGYGLIEDGAFAIKDSRIVWIGPSSELSKAQKSLAKEVYNVKGNVITPGLIDCHTHVVYAGDRAREFSMRLHGATYQDIAKQGGGILSTVKATTEASFDDLYAQSLRRVQAMIKKGVTTLEIKSGYGLLFDTEIKQLKVIEKLKQNLPIHIEATFLALHALPPEYKDRADEYVDYVCEQTLPFVAQKKLADAVDAFCENIAFSPAQTERLFKKAKDLGFKVKLHAEQLSNQKGAELVAKYEGLSADHLEHLDEAGVKAMAKAKMAAVLLPGAYYFLRDTQQPPIDLLRKHKVAMALSTDCNPGTSPTNNLPLMMNMAATLWRLTPEECLCGVTINAAQALGLQEKCGSLEIGKRADFVIWNVAHPDQLVYYIGQDCERHIYSQGKACKI